MNSEKRRDFLKLMGLSAATALATKLKPASAAVTGKPNILVIFSDQHPNRLWEKNNSFIKTPNLMRLANEGMTFQNALSNVPVCTPYRSMLLTGKYPRFNNCWDNDRLLNMDGKTFTDITRNQGYRNAYIGKWHLSAGRKENPDRHWIPTHLRPSFDVWKAYEAYHLYRAGTGKYYDEDDVLHTHSKYSTDGEADQINAFIDNHMANHAGKPFCCFWSMGPPHSPYEYYDNSATRAQPDFNYYKNNLSKNLPPNYKPGGEGTNSIAGHYAMCTSVDRSIGTVLDKLDSKGIKNNTIVVYTSDHGDMLSSHGLSRKRYPHEESINIPFIIRYPGKVPANKETDAILSTIDVMPSLFSLAGFKSAIPAGIQGIDLSHKMKGKGGFERDCAYIGITSFNSIAHPPDIWVGVRTKRYIFACFPKGSSAGGSKDGYVLFDIKKDPYELKNLVDRPETAGLQAALWDKLNDLLEKTGEKAAGFSLPPRPTPKGTYIKTY